MKPISENHPLRMHFRGLVEQTFCSEVGICNPRLNEYLTDLLVDFTHVDRLSLLSRTDGKELEQIAGMLTVGEDDEGAEQGDPPVDRVGRDRRIYRHIGDFTLFWAGVFPEHLKRSVAMPGDVLLTYVSQGKKSYAIASELTAEDDVLPASLFRHLSDDFEFCLYGLGLVRRGWGFPPSDGAELIY